MRELPSAPDAELAIVGALFRWPREAGSICVEMGITEESFTTFPQRCIFREQMEGWRNGIPLDQIGVIERLRSTGDLENIGGRQHIMSVVDHAPSGSTLRVHCDTVKGKTLLRGIMASCKDYYRRAAAQNGEPSEMIVELSTAITTLACGHSARDTKTLPQLIAQKVDRMTNGEPDKDVFPTGIAKLDEHSPLRAGADVLISGKRKSGKSILAITIATNLIRKDHRVLYFSLEDPASEVLNRVSAGMSRIPISRHNHHNSTTDECSTVIKSLQELATLPFNIRDDVYDISGIQAVSRQEKARHPELACIVIDYAQLVKAKVAKSASRQEEVAMVSRAIRLLAMELKVAILLLCQLNRDEETRESMALEQDCTAMWMVKTPDENEPRIKRISIPFQRNGESSVYFPLHFDGSIARFENHFPLAGE
jgi:replicative DNA helicase